MKGDPLAKLRDIHMPEPVSWWPPAPGWWLLLASILLCVAGLGLWLKRRKAKQAPPKQFSQPEVIDQALCELDQLATADSNTVAAELSALLRRVAIALRPEDDHIAGLCGDAWLNWLDAQWDDRAFSEGEGRMLLDAAYRSDAAVNLEQLLQLVRRWIEAQR